MENWGIQLWIRKSTE